MRARPWIRGGGGGCLSRVHYQRGSSRPSFARSFSQNKADMWRHIDWSSAPVRIVRPAFWSITAISTIYFTCAAYDVYQEAKHHPKDSRRSLDFDQLQAIQAARRRRERRVETDFSSPSAAWNSFSGPDRVLTCAAATSAAVQALSSVPSPAPRLWINNHLAHTPMDWHFRGPQLLTSAFVHDGPMHLLLNFFVMYQFAPKLARSPEFRNSGSHTLAFYLSAAIASALGGHISCRFPPNQMHRFSAGMGFSGVVSAVFAGWCLEHPDSRLRLFLIPFDFSATSMLQTSAVFETLGLLGVFQMLKIPINVSFGTHLSGLAFGAAYVTYAKKEKLWNAFRRGAFRSLKATGIV